VSVSLVIIQPILIVILVIKNADHAMVQMMINVILVSLG